MISRIRRKYARIIMFTALLSFILWAVLVKFSWIITCTVSNYGIKCSTSPFLIEAVCSSEKTEAVDQSLDWLAVEAPKLVICVFSRPQSVDVRNSCRNTWMKKFNDNEAFLLKFMIGTAGLDHEALSVIHAELETYGDLVLLDGHKEEYGRQCTEKLMLTFQWIINNTNATFVMKTDDDCYIRMQCLISLLKQANLHKPFLLGTIAKNEPPHVDGKWKDTGWHLTQEYLPFPYGSGYILLRSLIAEIVASDKVFPLRRYNNEDITLGLWLAQYNISYINMERAEVNGNSCSERMGVSAVIHCHGSPEWMYQAHNCQRFFK